LSPEDFEVLDRISFNQADRISDAVREKHISKYNHASTKVNVIRKEDRRTTVLSNTVVNLSSHPLSEDERTVLNKGPNFVFAPKSVPVEAIITGVEACLRKVSSETAEEIRLDATNILRKAKAPKLNVAPSEIRALSRLRANRDLVILKADKGNATVVMDRNEYDVKVSALLNDGSYSVLKRDPTGSIKRAVTDLIKMASIPEEDKKKLIPQNPRIPRLYCLPKVHKPNIPFRPIVSAIGSPTYNVSRYLATLLKPLVGQTDSFILNSSHFVQKLPNFQLSPGDILVSFDVESLFTKVPIMDTLDVLKDLFPTHGLPLDVLPLIQKCLTSTYFQFRNVFYSQVTGTAMGSPLSPVIANIFMEDFEQKALESAPLKPKCWFRYVDDTFVIWQHRRETLDAFLNHLNTRHDDIKFTMEVERDGILPFLDVKVTR
jgi:hypothetical protein